MTKEDHKILLTGATVGIERYYQPQCCPQGSQSAAPSGPKTRANFPGLFKTSLLLPPLSPTVMTEAPTSLEKRTEATWRQPIIMLTSSRPTTLSLHIPSSKSPYASLEVSPLLCKASGLSPSCFLCDLASQSFSLSPVSASAPPLQQLYLSWQKATSLHLISSSKGSLSPLHFNHFLFFL